MQATAGGGTVVGGALAVTVMVNGLGPLVPEIVTCAAVPPPGHVIDAVSCVPFGSWLTVTLCVDGSLVKEICVGPTTTPSTLNCVGGIV